MIKRRFNLILLCIAICFALGALFDYNRIPKPRFDSLEWKNAGNQNQYSYPRLKMADELISSRTLYGKNQEEVIELLGKPSDSGYFRSYDLVYWLGPERSWISIDSEWLVIKLDDAGKVKEYKLERD